MGVVRQPGSGERSHTVTHGCAGALQCTRARRSRGHWGASEH
jgi:hypothetical protein